MIYAIQVTGKFKSIKARSVPKQEAYRPLVDVAGDQKEFFFEEEEGENTLMLVMPVMLNN